MIKIRYIRIGSRGGSIYTSIYALIDGNKKRIEFNFPKLTSIRKSKEIPDDCINPQSYLNDVDIRLKDCDDKLAQYLVFQSICKLYTII